MLQSCGDVVFFGWTDVASNFWRRVQISVLSDKVLHLWTFHALDDRAASA